MHQRAAGYTLIELLVVMAILGLVAALATPMAGQAIAGARAKADARTLVSLLRREQHRATDEQHTVVVTAQAVRAENGAFALSGEATVDGAPVTFYPDGTSSGGVLHLHEGSRTMNIDVAWLTGALSVEDGT